MFKSHPAAVILIDMQDFFLKNHNNEIRKKLISNHLKVIDTCRTKDIPFITVEYKTRGIYRGQTTSALLQIIKKLRHKATIIKENNSAFTDTVLEETLKGLKTKKILLMGINANACVQDTAIAALHRGYKVLVSNDLMASVLHDGNSISKQNEKWYQKNCTLLETTDEVLKRLI